VFSETTKAKIKIEMSHIEHEIGLLQVLGEKNKIEEPDEIEIRSIASILHSFYNGIENIIKNILLNYGELLPNDLNWHKALLSLLLKKSELRTLVISEQLKSKLDKYMGFRHFFRHAYGFQFDWEMMKDLVEDVDAVWNDFKSVVSVEM